MKIRLYHCLRRPVHGRTWVKAKPSRKFWTNESHQRAGGIEGPLIPTIASQRYGLNYKLKFEDQSRTRKYRDESLDETLIESPQQPFEASCPKAVKVDCRRVPDESH